jgi:hypothetical protein
MLIPKGLDISISKFSKRIINIFFLIYTIFCGNFAKKKQNIKVVVKITEGFHILRNPGREKVAREGGEGQNPF